MFNVWRSHLNGEDSDLDDDYLDNWNWANISGSDYYDDDDDYDDYDDSDDYSDDDDDDSDYDDNDSSEMVNGYASHNGFKIPEPVKVERNDDILLSVLNSFMDNIDDKYTNIIENGDIYQLVKLPPSDIEYCSIKNEFDQSMKRRNRLKCPHYHIRKIEKIFCPHLLAQYKIKEDKKRDAQGRVYEEKLYHGTAKKNISSICKTNFDWRRCGTHVGTKFGKGISLAKYATYASFYPKTHEVLRTMLITNILYVRKQVGTRGMNLPDKGFDTTTNENGEVIVKYDDAEFCPLYVIYYC